jgi:hypothetical protein
MTRAAALALLALLAACAPAPRPAPPVITPAQLAILDRAERQVEHLGGAAARLRAAELRIAIAPTPAERRRAFAAYLSASQDLRSRP